MLKIRGSVIFKECATKSSVFIQSNSGRNICLLSTIWRNSRYKRTRIHFHPGPQVRHARRVVHCLKSVKTGNCLRAVQETKVHKTDELNATDELIFLPGITKYQEYSECNYIWCSGFIIESLTQTQTGNKSDGVW